MAYRGEGGGGSFPWKQPSDNNNSVGRRCLLRVELTQRQPFRCFGRDRIRERTGSKRDSRRIDLGGGRTGSRKGFPCCCSSDTDYIPFPVDRFARLYMCVCVCVRPVFFANSTSANSVTSWESHLLKLPFQTINARQFRRTIIISLVGSPETMSLHHNQGWATHTFSCESGPSKILHFDF